MPSSQESSFVGGPQEDGPAGVEPGVEVFRAENLVRQSPALRAGHRGRQEPADVDPSSEELVESEKREEDSIDRRLPPAGGEQSEDEESPRNSIKIPAATPQATARAAAKA